MTGLQRSPKVLIVSSSPIYASALQQLIGSSHVGAPSEILLDPGRAISEPDPPTDLVLLAPRDWRELGEWICPLQKHLPHGPWLILAERRMAGIFLPRLNAQPCLVVDPAGSPNALSTAMRATASSHCLHLPTAFMSLFARSEPFRPSVRSPRMPSIVELAISCGVSLGLHNPEIADALQVSEASVKTHLHHLMCRMNLTSRAALAVVVAQALTSEPQGHEPVGFSLALTP